MSTKENTTQPTLPLPGLLRGGFEGVQRVLVFEATGYESEREDAGRAPVQVQRGAQRGGVYSTGGYTADKTAPQD